MRKRWSTKKQIAVSRPYPYAYGFILDTTGADGDNLDCFIITDQKLESGQIVECEPVGLMEQMETSWDPAKGNSEEEDNNILAVLPDEKAEIDDGVKARLREFILHVFDHLPDKKVRVGNFLDRDSALQYIKNAEVKDNNNYD